MRAVADRLGTGPASLYAHVESKEELLALLIDRTAGEIPVPVVGAGPWQDQIKDLIRGIRAHVRRPSRPGAGATWARSRPGRTR